MAGGSTFAHLLGRKAKVEKDDKDEEARAKRAKDDDDEKDDDEDKKDARHSQKAEDKDDDDEDDKKAETDDKDDDEDDKKSRRAKRRASSDEDDESANSRGERIFACAAAGVRQDVAAHLAFKTNLSSRAAIELLNVVVAGQPAAAEPEKKPRTDLKSRMAQQPRYDVGPDAEREKEKDPGKALAAQILAAGQKRRGETPTF
jgi:hypothetical protein